MYRIRQNYTQKYFCLNLEWIKLASTSCQWALTNREHWRQPTRMPISGGRRRRGGRTGRMRAFSDWSVPSKVVERRVRNVRALRTTIPANRMHCH